MQPGTAASKTFAGPERRWHAPRLALYCEAGLDALGDHAKCDAFADTPYDTADVRVPCKPARRRAGSNLYGFGAANRPG